MDMLLNVSTNDRCLTWRQCDVLGHVNSWRDKAAEGKPECHFCALGSACLFLFSFQTFMMGIMRGFENRLKGQCRHFFTVVYLTKFWGTWKFVLVQKMIRGVHGIKIHPELPNAGVHLLAQDVENSITEIKHKCLLCSYTFL